VLLSVLEEFFFKECASKEPAAPKKKSDEGTSQPVKVTLQDMSSREQRLFNSFKLRRLSLKKCHGKPVGTTPGPSYKSPEWNRRSREILGVEDRRTPTNDVT